MPSPFPRETLEGFFAAVLINDVVDADLVPPAAVPLAHATARLEEHHRLARQSWASGLDREALRRVASAAMAGRQPDQATLTGFKHARARFKQVRYAFLLGDRRQRPPRLLGRATATMGQLQDACRHRQRGQAWIRGAQLRFLVAPPALALMRRGAAVFRPLDPVRFADTLCGDLDGLANLLASDAVSGHAFHAARKVVSRHNSFWTAMAVLHPCDRHYRLFRWMSAINGLMGACHDGLVERRVADLASYRAPFRLPDAVAASLDLLVRLPRLRDPVA